MITRVKVFKNIPEKRMLEGMMDDFKQGGAQVAWTQQPDGRYRLEVSRREVQPRKVQSLVTGEKLNRG